MKIASIVAFALFAACGGGGGLTYKLTPSAGLYPPPEAKPATCDFVVGGGPSDGAKYDKLGTLAPTDFAAQTVDELKSSIAAQVCQLGGDYVIAKQDETGKYRDVTVLRHHMDAPAGGGSGAAPAPAPAPAPAGSAAPTP
ncbi:MAG TPA: hypothetical protein VGL61_03720 [Kofleriaceae bacterium]|jgi:hypothetical protein